MRIDRNARRLDEHGVSTPRLLLRPFREADLEERYVSWLNDPAVVRYSDQRFHAHTLESCRTYLDGFVESENQFVAIVERETGRAIGTMTAYVNARHRTADMGILIGERSRWGRGYGLEAWAGLMQWLLRDGGMRKVTGGTMACNTSMCSVMIRAGMTLEGVRRQQQLLDDEPVDVVLYGRLAVDDRPAG